MPSQWLCFKLSRHPQDATSQTQPLVNSSTARVRYEKLCLSLYRGNSRQLLFPYVVRFLPFFVLIRGRLFIARLHSDGGPDPPCNVLDLFT